MLRWIGSEASAYLKEYRMSKAAFGELDEWIDYRCGRTIEKQWNGKILILGFPKTGNNWVKGLLSDYFDLPGIEPVRHYFRKGVGVSHLPFCRRLSWRRDFIHSVYLMRDLRDVVASFFAYAQTDFYRQTRPECVYEDIELFYFDYFLPRIAHALQLDTHAEGYACRGVPVLRYERLWDNPEEELKRLIARWGLPVEMERIQHAVSQNQLARLKKTGREFEQHVPPSHFRKGGYGNYRNELPDKIIHDIEQRYGDLLRRWAYL